MNKAYIRSVFLCLLFLAPIGQMRGEVAGWWRFNDTKKGKVNDLSGKHNTAVLIRDG